MRLPLALRLRSQLLFMSLLCMLLHLVLLLNEFKLFPLQLLLQLLLLLLLLAPLLLPIKSRFTYWNRFRWNKQAENSAKVVGKQQKCKI